MKSRKRSLSTPNLQKQREDHQPRGDPNLTVKSPPTLLSEEKVQWVNDLHEDIHILKPLLDEIITGQRKILQEVRAHFTEAGQSQAAAEDDASSASNRSTPNPYQEAARHGRMAAWPLLMRQQW